MKPALSVILNPRCNGGRGLARWKRLRTSHEARTLGLTEANLFDGAGILDAAHLREQTTDWVMEEARAGKRHFVAAGGDGTVHLAVNALHAVQRSLGVRLSLGAIGLGSSNDFHKPFPLAGRSMQNGLRCRLDFDQATPHDLGEIVFEGPTKSSRVFAINASIGLTAEANRYFNTAGPRLDALKRWSVNGAIAVAAGRELLRFRNLSIDIALDDQEWKPFHVVNAGIVKNPHFSGSFRYDNEYRPRSGKFFFQLCEDMGRAEVLGVMGALARGKFAGRAKTRTLEPSRVGLRAQHTFALEADGEVIEATRAWLRVLPGEISLCP